MVVIGPRAGEVTLILVHGAAGRRWDGIDATGAERVTPNDATQSQPGAAQEPVRVQRFDGVFTARGAKLARAYQQGAQHGLIAADHGDRDGDQAIPDRRTSGT